MILPYELVAVQRNKRPKEKIILFFVVGLKQFGLKVGIVTEAKILSRWQFC